MVLSRLNVDSHYCRHYTHIQRVQASHDLRPLSQGIRISAMGEHVHGDVSGAARQEVPDVAHHPLHGHLPVLL